MREVGKAIAYILVVAVVALAAVMGGLTFKQVVAVTVLAIFIAGSLFYWTFRNAFALFGVSLLLILHTIDIEHLVMHSQLDVILFIVGMMIIIGALEKRGFFDWLISSMLKPVIDKPVALIAILLFLGYVMAALVDEVTSILFTMSIMLRILEAYDVDPIPFIVFLVFTTNIGSSATVVGNPIGVLIAFNAGFSFLDFIRWSTPASLLAVASIIGIALLVLKGYIEKMRAKIERGEVAEVRKLVEVKWGPHLKAPLALFIAVLAGLIMHHDLEKVLGLPHNALLLGVPLLGAAAALFMEHRHARDIVEHHVDWWTLLYFILLFGSVGTLAYTGVTKVIASAVYKISASNEVIAMLLMSGVAGFLTAFMDNVLAVATLIPVVKALGAYMNVFMLWWVLLMAGTYWGNATVIGSTANIVAAGYLEKKYKRTFSMTGWMKIGVPICIISYAIAFLWLYAQLGIAPHWVPPTH
ncbi:MAG: hypothetical protein GXO09_02700 [Crenarchaeota archaeon]|nr:hypothetical protein [Thermoproteota archaeon]